MNQTFELLRRKYLNQFEFSDIIEDKEGKEYAATQFKLNNRKALYREGKQTPKKVGYFVTLWKRSKSGPITPFHDEDNIHICIVYVSNNNHSGLYFFPKTELIKRGIFQSHSKEGKRAFRIYPPWVITTSTQAEKSKTWQNKFFSPLKNLNTNHQLIDIL